MSFALNEYNRAPKVKIKLVTKDTKRDAQTCADAVTSLAEEEDSAAVILGPVFIC